MTRTVAHLVADVLAELGVGHVFGVVGSGNFDVTNALIASGVPFTAARHEGGAASMADGYSRFSTVPGVLTVHQGCGLTNAVTGIGEAAKSRTPLIVLAADVAASSRLSNFRIDQDALVLSVGAVPERVHSAATAVADVTRAWQTAVHGRRTVVINLPLAPAWAKLLQIPRPYLYAGIVFFATLGAYSVNLQAFDLGILLVLGLLGFMMRRYGLPILPLILGVILGPRLEAQLRTSLQLSEGRVSGLFSEPVALVVYAIVALVLLWPLARRLAGRTPAARAEGEPTSEEARPEERVAVR